MIIYKFKIPHSKEIIKQRVSAYTIPYSIGNIGYTNAYIGYFSKNKLIIGKTPKYKVAHAVRFFCGILTENKSCCYLKGVFMYPIKMMIPQFVFFLVCVFVICIINKNIVLLPISLICYGIIVAMWMFIHNIRTKSSQEIIQFITERLDGSLI